jgi:hypothetical protein
MASSSSPSNSMKWKITLFSALIFILIVNPYTYELTNSIFHRIIGPVAVNGCPTAVGLILHTIVYILIVRYSMDLRLFK